MSSVQTRESIGKHSSDITCTYERKHEHIIGCQLTDQETLKAHYLHSQHGAWLPFHIGGANNNTHYGLQVPVLDTVTPRNAKPRAPNLLTGDCWSFHQGFSGQLCAQNMGTGFALIPKVSIVWKAHAVTVSGYCCTQVAPHLMCHTPRAGLHNCYSAPESHDMNSHSNTNSGGLQYRQRNFATLHLVQPEAFMCQQATHMCGRPLESVSNSLQDPGLPRWRRELEVYQDPIRITARPEPAMEMVMSYPCLTKINNELKSWLFIVGCYV